MREKDSCANRIKSALSIRGMMQSDLCRITGIPKSAMSQYCSGAIVPRQNRTYLIAKALDVSEAWLMGYDVPMERSSSESTNIWLLSFRNNLADALWSTDDADIAAAGLDKNALSEMAYGDGTISLAEACSIAEMLGSSLNEMVDWNDQSAEQKAPSISDEAMKFAARYEKLDSVGRGAVDAIMKYEEGRMTDAVKKAQQFNLEAAAMLDMIVYTNPSAAGIPLYAENDYEHIEFPASEVPRGADFGVRISGDSMEPTIHDGTIVWVHKVPELQEGQIGIFMVDDGAVCKRFYSTDSGIELRSDNSKYDPIKVSEFVRLGIVGRVLGYK